jgi:hypothetical protein
MQRPGQAGRRPDHGDEGEADGIPAGQRQDEAPVAGLGLKPFGGRPLLFPGGIRLQPVMQLDFREETREAGCVFRPRPAAHDRIYQPA